MLVRKRVVIELVDVREGDWEENDAMDDHNDWKSMGGEEDLRK